MDRELVAATMAILKLPKKGMRIIILRTDKQNVLCWAESSKSRSHAENRILRALNLFCLNRHVDVIPVYVLSERDIIAGGLTRRSEYGVDDWPSHGKWYLLTPRMYHGLICRYRIIQYFWPRRFMGRSR